MTACMCDGTMSLISLFDGIGGFPLAFSRAGVPTRATVEIDKAAAGVAADHFPEAKHFPDVTEVTPDELLATGFCRVHGSSAQAGRAPISPWRVFASDWVAHVRASSERSFASSSAFGPGGSSWRTSPVSCHPSAPAPAAGSVPTAPARQLTLFEEGPAGAPGDLEADSTAPDDAWHSTAGGMGTVLRRLGECGYGLAYRVLAAQHFGVPQRRRRVVIVGHLGDAAGPAEVLLEPEGGGRHSAPGSTAGAGSSGIAGRGVTSPGGGVAPTLQGGGKRGYRIDAETAAGGGHETAALTTTSVTGTDDSSAQGGQLVATTLTAREGKGPDSDATTTLVVSEPEIWQQQGSKVQPMGTMRRGNGNVTGGVPFLAHALTGEGSDASEDSSGRGAPLVPVDLTQITSGANRSNPQAGDPNGTLSAGGRPAIAFGHTNGIDPQASEHHQPKLMRGQAVRRLTPVECERLQGYPDGWTATSCGRLQSDSPRYRQLGNSIAVPVFEWVARRIMAVEERS